MACCFAIDKQESLAIIQSIIDSIPVEDDELDEIPLYKHKLGVTEIKLNIDFGGVEPCIEDYYNEVIEESNKYIVNRYDDDVGFALRHISISNVDGKEWIGMETYLHC
jgi:hypothetical protein